MSAVCGALSPRVGVRGDALVRCPAEGDSLGAAEDLSAGPDSLPPGIKTGNIQLLTASDSRLNYPGVLRKVLFPAPGWAAQQVPRKG